MEKQFLKKFKIRLESEKNDILYELRKIATQNKNDPNKWESKFIFSDNESGHEEMEVEEDESEEYGQRQSVVRSLSQSLNDINLALKKIDDGTYGKCENCNQNIPYERLEAFPAARICLDCNASKKISPKVKY